jgi:hypothetical protein
MINLIAVMSTLGVHITCLTGTMPPTLEDSFRSVSKLIGLEVIRMPTIRTEIAYSVVIRLKAELLDVLIGYVKSRTNDYASEEHGMIFCRSRKDADLVASKLGLEPYYAQLENSGKLNNDRIFKKWYDGAKPLDAVGTSQWIVATSILSLGVDVRHVRDVLQYDVPFNLLEDHQEKSRAGRDGKPSRAITFVAEGRGVNHDDSKYDLGSQYVVPLAFAKAPNCRRLFHLFLDGVADSCTHLGAELCDLCEGQLENEPPRALRAMPLDISFLLDPNRKPATSNRSTAQLPSGMPNHVPSRGIPAHSLAMSSLRSAVQTPANPATPLRAIAGFSSGRAIAPPFGGQLNSTLQHMFGETATQIPSGLRRVVESAHSTYVNIH